MAEMIEMLVVNNISTMTVLHGNIVFKNGNMNYVNLNVPVLVIIYMWDTLKPQLTNASANGSFGFRILFLSLY